MKKSKVSSNTTSSAEFSDGPTPCSLPVGIQTDLFGQVLAPANHSRQQAKEKVRRTKDTSGLTCSGSLKNAALQSFSESKSTDEVDENGLLVSRECSKCKMRKLSSEFYKDFQSRLGHHSRCGSCMKESSRVREAKKPKDYRKKLSGQWRETNRAKVLMARAKERAKSKGLEYSLDGCASLIQGVIDAGVCELTGIPFRLDGGKTWDSPSLDRIDSSEGYFLENVRVVLYCVNVMANIWGENKIIEIADAIMESRREVSANLQGRLESALKRQIDTQVSPEYEMTWRASVMQSGVPICRLVATLRRTSEEDCSGWPTPAAQEFEPTDIRRMEERRAEIKEQGINGNGFGLTLGMASHLVSWPTPDSSHHGMMKPEAVLERIKNHQPHLDDVASLAGWPTTNDAKQAQAARNLSGQTRLSSPASTENSGEFQGVLNPAFSLWLMGYPSAWIECGKRAMLKCSRSRKAKKEE